MPARRGEPYLRGVTQSLIRATVCVAVDPFLLRSALYQCMLLDPRFEVLLCPQEEDPGAFARAGGAPAVLASTHVDVPDAQVITVAAPAGRTEETSSADLEALLDLIELTMLAKVTVSSASPPTLAPDKPRVGPGRRRST